MKGLSTEVVVASYNGNFINIIVLIPSYSFSLNLIAFKAERRAIETTMALPWRYQGATMALPGRRCGFGTVSMHK